MKLGIHIRFCLIVAVSLALVVGMSCAIYASGESNLALNGNASASASWSSEYGPEYGNDSDAGTRWSGFGSGTDWWEVDWSTAQTFNAVVINNQSSVTTTIIVQVWDDQTGLFVNAGSTTSVVGTNTIYFPTVTSTKLRLQNVISFWEAEVYNYTSALVQGNVTCTQTSAPVAGAMVTIGEQSTTTDTLGFYHLSIDPGTYTVKVSKAYMFAEQSVIVYGGQLTSCNVELNSKNLALAGTASASTSQSTMPPNYANDENSNTRWEAETTDTVQLYEINWEEEQTFNTVIVNTYDSPDYYLYSLTLEAYNSETYQYETIAGVGDGILPLDAVVTFDLSSTTTSAIRLSYVRSLVDVEVYNLSTVSGTVTDSASSSPIGCVAILGGLSTVYSASNGTYSLRVPVGDCVIRASADTYEDIEEELTVSTCDYLYDFVMQRIPNNLTMLASGATATNPGDGPAAYAIDGYPCTTYSVPSLNYHGDLTIEWASAQTIDTIIIRHGSRMGIGVDVWKDGAWVQVYKESAYSIGSFEVEFSPQSTTKIRFRNLLSATEVEIYNLNGSAVQENLTGTVTSALTGNTLSGVIITVGDQSVETGESGRYYLSVPSGASTVSASRTLYDSASQTVVVPSGGTATANFVLTTNNIAPLASATASEEYTGFGASLGNDDNMETRFSTNGNSDQWYQLTWGSEVTFNTIRMHLLDRSMQYMKAEIWDGSVWQEMGTATTSSSVVELTFSSTATTMLRITGVISFYEIEVVNTSAIEGSIGSLIDYEDGTLVKLTGAVSAIFDDAAYVEDLDRSSAIQVLPVSKFSTNIGALGTASASDTYTAEPGYEADKANDGNTGTRWSSNGGADGWYQIQWDTQQTINAVEILNANLATTAIIQAWNSDTNSFDDVSVVDIGFHGTRYVAFSDVTTTVLRIQNVISLWEVEVFCAPTLQNKEVEIIGALATAGNERVINAGQVISLGVEHPVLPLGVIGRSFSTDYGGACTIGLLTRTCGKVSSVESDYFYLDDGSGVASDSSYSNVSGIKVGPIDTLAVGGEIASVTGIAGVTTVSGVKVRTLRPRSMTDVELSPMVLGDNLALSGFAGASDTYTDEPGYEAGKGIDANADTRWSSNGATADFDITWSSPQKVNRVVLNNQCAQAGTLVVKVFNDSTGEFETVGSADLLVGTVAVGFSDKVTTTVRLSGLISFWEVEIYDAVPDL